MEPKEKDQDTFDKFLEELEENLDPRKNQTSTPSSSSSSTSGSKPESW